MTSSRLSHFPVSPGRFFRLPPPEPVPPIPLLPPLFEGGGWLLPPGEKDEEEEESATVNVVDELFRRRQCCVDVVKAFSRLLEAARAANGIEAADVEGSAVPVRPRIGLDEAVTISQ